MANFQEIPLQQVTKQKERHLVRNIFEHSQGDPGRTEELLILALALQLPKWRIKNETDFIERLYYPVDAITSRRDRHTDVNDPHKDITSSLRRLRQRLGESRNFIGRERLMRHKVELDELIPEIANEMICRDWLYLVHDNGRPKDGLRSSDNYDPNKDRWFSYVAYYALWKDENGRRRSTGIAELDTIYAKVGNYLDTCLISELGIDKNYEEGRGMHIYEKLTQALTVYDYRQKVELQAPERCVLSHFFRQTNAASVFFL